MVTSDKLYFIFNHSVLKFIGLICKLKTAFTT